jgi:hypothetical protein
MFEIHTAGNEDEGSVSVNNTSRLSQNSCGLISDALIDTPVVGCTVGFGERTEVITVSPDESPSCSNLRVCNGAIVLGSVNSTENGFSIGV